MVPHSKTPDNCQHNNSGRKQKDNAEAEAPIKHQTKNDRTNSRTQHHNRGEKTAHTADNTCTVNFSEQRIFDCAACAIRETK